MDKEGHRNVPLAVTMEGYAKTIVAFGRKKKTKKKREREKQKETDIGDTYHGKRRLSAKSRDLEEALENAGNGSKVSCGKSVFFYPSKDKTALDDSSQTLGVDIETLKCGFSARCSNADFAAEFLFPCSE